MATTEEILKAARDLGKLISEHSAGKKFVATLTRLQGDVEAQRLLNDYHRLAGKVEEKQAAGKPIEVEEKRQIEKAQMAVIKNPLLSEFQKVQMDYVDLMRQVDEAMNGAGPEAAVAPPSAGPAGAKLA